MQCRRCRISGHAVAGRTIDLLKKMMNIVVFETETWAQTAWQRMKGDHEVYQGFSPSGCTECLSAKLLEGIAFDINRIKREVLK